MHVPQELVSQIWQDLNCKARDMLAKYRDVLNKADFSASEGKL
jgi:hypothetical protein